MRLFTRIENSGYGSDSFAGLLGLIFFSFTVGFDKLNPRNLAWLTFGDQQAHLLGWWFYASDQWRWPLGANPMLGWEGTNSIVYTDSWPGLALIFKVLNIEVIKHGQYFGLGFLLGSVALFVGARRLFASLGVGLVPSLAAAGLLNTTPVFWYMQRWYPALSAGLPILVWALYLYVDDPRRRAPRWRSWSTLLVIAVATHAYLTIVAIPILGALLVRRFIHDRRSWFSSLIGLSMLGGVTAASMYLLGYFTLPSKWAQTGGYGKFSSNILGLFDLNDASRLLPDLPSLPAQYEPTSLGIGTLLLATALLANRRRSRVPFGIPKSLKEHAPLAVVLIGLAILAVTNTVSIGSWSFRIPLPVRLEYGLSIFRSSARMLWPTLIVLSVLITLTVLRRLRYGAFLVSLVLAIQIVDSTPEIRKVALRADGTSVPIPYDQAFWSRVPERYTTIASLPADNYGFDWFPCTLAAVKTNRAAECGYFGRVQGLENVNSLRLSEVLTGALEDDVIYMVSIRWLVNYELEIIEMLENRPVNAIAAVGVRGFSPDTVFFFPKCASETACDFVGDLYRPFDVSLIGNWS